MRSRACLWVASTLLVLTAFTATASAAPRITAHGFTNPVAWGLKSLKTTHFRVRTDAPGSWCVVEVRNSKGVVRTLASRAIETSGTYSFFAWDGRDARGSMLPTGNYAYRVTLSKGGQASQARGMISVSRVYFVLKGESGPKTGQTVVELKRYFYSEPWSLYATVTKTGSADGYANMIGWDPDGRARFEGDRKTGTQRFAGAKGWWTFRLTTIWMPGIASWPSGEVIRPPLVTYYTLVFIE